MPAKAYRIFLGNNEHILVGDNLVAMPAETFSEKPLYSVADDRISYFRTNGYAKPGLSSLVRFGDNQEMGAIELFPPTRQAQKLWPFSQTGLLWKIRLASRQHPPFLSTSPLRRHSNCQPFSPLGPSSFQYLASPRGFHPNEKAMGPFAADIAGLVGSFHSSSTPLGRVDGQVFISIIDSRYCQFRKVPA